MMDRVRRVARWAILVALLAAGLVLASAHVITEWWWFQELGQPGVLVRLVAWPWGVRLGGLLVLALIAYVNVRLTQPAVARAVFRFKGEVPPFLSWRFVRRGMILAAGLIGVVSSEPLAGRWDVVARFVFRQPFGISDPLFGRDVAFFVFELPFLRLLLGTLTSVLVLSSALVVAVYAVARAVEWRGSGVLLADGPRRHLFVLAALFVLLKVAGYRLSLLELPLATSSDVIFGATYTDWHARAPALQVLSVLAAAFAALLLLGTRRLYRKALIATGTAWALAAVLFGGVYPIVVQRFVVEPNELERERPFIEHHLEFTRLAYGLDRVEQRPFPVDNRLTWEDLESRPDLVDNIRLWDWRPLLRTLEQLQAIRFYYTFPDVDVDRYTINGRLRQVMLAVRELDLAQISNPTWVNRHLQYTHGYGVVVSSVGEQTAQGLPRLLLADIPPRPRDSDLAVSRPEIYFGQLTNHYVIVGTRTPDFEFSYPSGDDNVRSTYRGAGGIPLNSMFRRAVFAARFRTANLLLSDEITQTTRVLFRRNIMERVRRLAPFLVFDRDPYPVLADGRLFWMIDAYTVAQGFPYAMPHPRWGANYVRNSVKAVVDAYHGAVNFYVFDPRDPVIRAYDAMFPGLLRPAADMPEALRAHVRYPEDLFTLQAEMLATYHMTNPTVFYNREDVWRFAREIYSSEGDGPFREETMAPYYVLVQLDGEQPEMVLMLPFTPAERNNMIAWLAARMDGDNYGKLLLYEFPKDELIYGPMQIEARIDQHPEISQELTLWAQRGSQVIRGNMLVLPVERSLLYIKPIFLQAETGDLPELVRVIAATGDRLGMHPTLIGALREVVPLGAGDARAGTPAPAPQQGGTSDSGPEPAVPGPGALRSRAGEEWQELARQALAAYELARERLSAGDWAGYGQALEELERILVRLAATD